MFLIAIFALGFGFAYAYFTSTASRNGTLQFKDLELDIQNSSGTSMVTDSYSWKASKLYPGDTLTIENYRVANTGEAPCYALINFDITIVPTSNANPTLRYSTWYNLNGDLVHTANINQNATASSLIAPGANTTLNFNYILSGEDITNEYQGATANMTLTAFGIQSDNLPSVTTPLQATKYIVNNSGVGTAPTTYTLTINDNGATTAYTLVGGSTIQNSMKPAGLNDIYNGANNIGLFKESAYIHTVNPADCLWGNQTLYTRESSIDTTSTTNTDFNAITPSTEAVTITTATGSTAAGEVVIPSKVSVYDEVQQKYVYIPVTTIDANAFEGNENITSVTIPSGVTSIGASAFSGCKKLETVNIPNTVTSIGNSAFMDSGLEDIDLDDAEALEAFLNSSLRNTNITEITVPASVTSIGNYAFAGCSELTTFEFEYGSSLQSIGSCAFLGCSKLESLIIPSGTILKCSQLFRDCSSLATLDVSGCDVYNLAGPTQDFTCMFYNCSSLTSLDLSKWNTSKVNQMAYMFFGCSNLTSLNLSNFNTSKVTNMISMFSGCAKLTSLDVSHFDTSNVTNMGNMFLSCSQLTELDVSSFNTSNVTTMEHMFRQCSKLTELDLSSFNTSNVTNMRSMFSGCSSLESLNLSNFSTSNVTNMQSMFSSCSSLTSLDVSNFDTSNVTDMQNMFYNCSSLTSLDVSNFVTTNCTNMQSVFSHCSGLTTIYASANFVTTNVTNSTSMFYGCTALVGGNGTAYNSSKVDKEYAVIDATGTPGYFTAKS